MTDWTGKPNGRDMGDESWDNLSKAEILDRLVSLGKILDEQPVPQKGRVLSFGGKDGNIYCVSIDNPDPVAMSQMPDAIKEAFKC